MSQDPAVEEVREAREKYFERFNYDLDAMFDDLEKHQAEGGRVAVSLPPKRLESITAHPGT
jgi:hypothetical protein